VTGIIFLLITGLKDPVGGCISVAKNPVWNDSQALLISCNNVRDLQNLDWAFSIIFLIYAIVPTALMMYMDHRKRLIESRPEDK
jgi:hypothetical protein